jgi:hypothetical protein
MRRDWRVQQRRRDGCSSAFNLVIRETCKCDEAGN